MKSNLNNGSSQNNDKINNNIFFNEHNDINKNDVSITSEIFAIYIYTYMYVINCYYANSLN